MRAYKVLSIDAWGNSADGFEWNNWFNVGTVDLDLPNESNQSVLQAMQDAGYITQTKGADLEDDGYNWVVLDGLSREPLFAIEYGSVMEDAQ